MCIYSIIYICSYGHRKKQIIQINIKCLKIPTCGNRPVGYLYSTAKELNLEPPDYKSSALTTWLCHLHGFRT